MKAVNSTNISFNGFVGDFYSSRIRKVTIANNYSRMFLQNGNYILGNGALLTGVITSVANINSGTSNVTVVSANGNVTVGVGGTATVEGYFDNAGTPYMPTPGSANNFFSNSQGDNDRSNPLNYPPSEPWRAPNIGLYHDKRTGVVFMDGHAESVPKTSPITFGSNNDIYWILGQ